MTLPNGLMISGHRARLLRHPTMSINWPFANGISLVYSDFAVGGLFFSIPYVAATIATISAVARCVFGLFPIALMGESACQEPPLMFWGYTLE